ncbi:metallo-beta-lactamase superfamily protein [Ureibacillus xyleni]|uniref:Metallo-beta-lactamase superfamily protein n=1 Tax=Ureibacillus xyleni TaxID=614648 RepID=A0A285RY74_9BACL|nr:MBL fold metallo-hydrolase [Ureibacillus xyleni]SOB99283.1 metallo-beta-lactamase superfamily protein [Ureibacillus xyleni]
MITYKLFQTGYCTHNAKVALKGEPSYEMKFPAMVALLKHPVHGNILFDTGYTTKFYEETKKFPYSLYAKITPVFVKEKDHIVEQLKRENIGVKEIKYIFLSHFHADHMCALKDFPYSQFICSKEAYLSVKNKKGVRAVLSAYIPTLLPEDFGKRVHFIEDKATALIDKPELNTIHKVFQKPLYDIWGDGSCLAINLSGHAKGQYGLIFENETNETIFLLADAVWRSKAFRENLPPSKLAYIIMDNSEDYKENFQKIVKLHSIEKKIKMIPSHCEEPFQVVRG